MEDPRDLVTKLRNSDNYFDRQKAAWALVGLGDKSVDALIDALEKGEQSELRYKAAWALGKIKCPRSIDPLARAMLSDPDHAVREWCAAALEEVGDRSSVPHLMEAMKADAAKDVRLRAAVALRNLGAVEALVKLQSIRRPRQEGWP